MVTAGGATLLAAVLLVAGEALADAGGLGRGVRGRCAGRSPSRSWSPRSRCSSRSRRAGASPRRPGSRSAPALAALLWLLFTGALALWIGATENFGATYGPLAGTIAVLLWTFLTALAVLLGLAFAAQLEAVRAGVTATRVAEGERHG